MASGRMVQLSPNSLNLFLECQHCFWLDKNLNIKRPLLYPYELNMAVDELLKEEFDAYRKRREGHPLLAKHKIKAKLFPNQRLLNEWRDAKRGIRHVDEDLKAALVGAPDDVLKFADGALAPLDYKSTGAKISKVYDRFQLQLDVYAYLLEKNGYELSGRGYLAFYLVDKSKGFVDRLPFKKEIIEVKTNPGDVPEMFKDAVRALREQKPPRHSRDCQFGKWTEKDRNFLH